MPNPYKYYYELECFARDGSLHLVTGVVDYPTPLPHHAVKALAESEAPTQCISFGDMDILQEEIL